MSEEKRKGEKKKRKREVLRVYIISSRSQPINTRAVM